jgi:hypothetical protein
MGKINVRIISCIVGISLFCYSSNVMGRECPKPVQPISEGQSANCTGYLFSDKAESDAYKATRIAELQKEENEILQKRLDLYIKQSETLAKQISKKDSTEGFVRIGYFVLGAVLTGVIASNVR